MFFSSVRCTRIAIAVLIAAGSTAVGGAATRPQAAVLVVSPRGGLSLSAAQAAARAAAAHGQRVTVLLHGGTYTLAAPLELRRLDSGRPGAPVAYRNYPGEQPVLSGGRRIAGWQPRAD